MDQVRLHHCPIGSCDWAFEDKGAPRPAASDSHARAVNTAIREHLQTHPLEQWAEEVVMLRVELEVARAALPDELARVRAVKAEGSGNPRRDIGYLQPGPLPPTTCIRCGALVGNVDIHDAWHLAQEATARPSEGD